MHYTLSTGVHRGAGAVHRLAGAHWKWFVAGLVCFWLAALPGIAQTPDEGVAAATSGHEAPVEDGGGSEETGCTETPTTLCLQDSRYEVSATWSTLEGESGEARTVRARTADSGLFWFFEPGNWEMLVKVLDGCTFNSHHWVFAASATDLGLDLVVRDTRTNEMKRYLKEPGRPAPAVADVGAFPLGCES